jgi:hypothetical protein
LSVLFGIELTNIDKPTSTAVAARPVKKTIHVKAAKNKVKAKRNISERKKRKTPDKKN